MNLASWDRFLPVLSWGRQYDRHTFTADLIAALIVTIMLIPQSLAYALLAGLSPEADLYASIVPIILYSIFGTSRTLAVGPVALVSLMTAAAVGNAVEAGTADYASAALVLAGLSGGILYLLGNHLGSVHVVTLAIGTCAIGFLFWVRKGLKPLLLRRKNANAFSPIRN